MKNSVTALRTAAAPRYREAAEQGQSLVRQAVLDAASALLVAEGPSALSMRRIAAHVGSSTTVLYTLFGGKEGLAEALYLEGFARLARRLAAAPADVDPLTRLFAIGDAYRATALADGNYYGVMFEQAIPGYTPSPAARAQARTTLQVAVEAVRHCMAAGVFADGEPAEVADVLWAATHGAVSLERAGFFHDGPTAGARYRAVVTATVSAFLATPQPPG